VQQVQADEIKVKISGWGHLAGDGDHGADPLWLGGVISHRRDQALIQNLVDQVRAVALCGPCWWRWMGWSVMWGPFNGRFAVTAAVGQPGRCQLRPWTEVAIVQVVKQRLGGQLSIVRRIVQGSSQQVAELLQLSQAGGQINTAFIERLNATFRQRLVWLARRSRNWPANLKLAGGHVIVGCIYNFCTYHDSLRVAVELAKGGRRWLQRTPAIAAGLTDHQWTIDELFNFKVPPPRWNPAQTSRPAFQTDLTDD